MVFREQSPKRVEILRIANLFLETVTNSFYQRVAGNLSLLDRDAESFHTIFQSAGF
jgi:hypothetical protein